MVVLVAEVAVAIEKFHVVEVGVFDLSHQSHYEFLQLGGYFSLEAGEELVHLESRVLPLLLEGGGRVEAGQKVGHFLFSHEVLIAVAVGVELSNTGGAGVALGERALLEDAKLFGPPRMFTHLLINN